MYKQIATGSFFLIVLALTCFIIYQITQAQQKSQKKRSVLSLLFVWYLCAIAAVTIIPLRESRTQNLPHHINLKPVVTSYHRLKGVVSSDNKWARQNFRNNLFGNILMFIPLGLFLPWLYRKGFGQVVLIGCSMSASIELIQYLNMFAGYNRYVDIDDVILNTLGAIIGYWIFKKFLHARKFSRL
jgi:glycopeptide antibiotics resistance protein